MTQTSDMIAYYQKIRDAVSKGAYIVSLEDLGVAPSFGTDLNRYKTWLAEQLDLQKTLNIINEAIKMKDKSKVATTAAELCAKYIDNNLTEIDKKELQKTVERLKAEGRIKEPSIFNHVRAVHDKTFNRSIVTMPADFMEVGNGTIQKGDLLKYKCGQIAEASLTIGNSVENYAPFFKVYRDVKVMANPPKTSQEVMSDINPDTCDHLKDALPFRKWDKARITKKSLDELQKEFRGNIDINLSVGAIVEQISTFIEEKKEAILLAWYAEYGFVPGNACIVSQYKDGQQKIWIEEGQSIRSRASQLGYSTEEEIITALKQHSKMVEAMK